MTLILVAGNEDQIVQISDRRLSNQVSVVTEESNKVGSLVCRDGRFLYGYAGLAEFGTFKARKWIMDTLFDCAEPDYLSQNIIKRFQKKATEYFNTSKEFAKLKKSQRRISIIFTGYLNTYNPPVLVQVILSNYMDFITKTDRPEAIDLFETYYLTEKNRPERKCQIIQRIGNWTVMTSKQVEDLRDLLKTNKPPLAIGGKGIEIIREMSDISNKTIGKQINTLCLPSNPNLPITGSYHTNVLSNIYFMPDIVQLIPEQYKLLIGEMNLSPVHPDKVPATLIPKVGRNKPCPCGSGIKYKRCHGK